MINPLYCRKTNNMDEFVKIITSFPTIVPTVILGVVVIYWMIAILGMVDVDIFDIDTDSEVDVGGGGLAGFLIALGLSGVPFTIIFSFVVLWMWLLSFLATDLLMPLFSSMLLQAVIGCIILVVNFFIALPLTKYSIKPLRSLFITHQAEHQKENLIGKSCEVKSLKVNDSFGQATYKEMGASLIISIKSQTPNQIKRGDVVVVLSYDEAADVYEVVTQEQFNQ